jgi:alpha-1,3-rhamnosyl/mannosyltransferase
MKNMIIGVDLRCLPRDGSFGAGVAHAARALCMQLSKIEIHKLNQPYQPSSPKLLESGGLVGQEFEFVYYVPEGASWESGDVVRLNDATGRSLRLGLHKNPCDLLFVPSGSIAPAIKVPVVPWVHDLIIFEHPEWFDQSWLQRKITTYLFAKGLRKAPIIFAVSEYTKSQIAKLLNIDSGKIVVTNEGGDPELSEIRNTKYEIRKVEAKEFCENELGLARDFVLCLGTVEPRKNIVTLIRAWKKARQKSAQVPDLVVAGANGWKFDDVEKEIKGLTATENQFFHRYKSVTDDQRRTLLLGADMVMVPSLDEGFGLVALEAMQAGTPVAVSNRGALPEVVGEAGMIIDADDEDGWALAFLTCVTDERACILRSEMGLKQAEMFSWEKTAETVVKLLATSL